MRAGDDDAMSCSLYCQDYTTVCGPEGYNDNQWGTNDDCVAACEGKGACYLMTWEAADVADAAICTDAGPDAC